jgi:hypothetical protein
VKLRAFLGWGFYNYFVGFRCFGLGFELIGLISYCSFAVCSGSCVIGEIFLTSVVSIGGLEIREYSRRDPSR